MNDTLQYQTSFRARWADLDANIHMRHSAYNDYAAQARFQFLSDHGFGTDWFSEHNVFPVLFREETIFRREISGNEAFHVEVLLRKLSEDGARWSLMNIFTKANDVHAATLVVDGAWLHPVKRKLTVPPAGLSDLFHHLKKTEDFEWIDYQKK